MRRVVLVVLSGLTSAVLVAAQAPSSSSLDAAMQAYWSAAGESDRESAARRIVATGAAFAEVHRRLEAGRSYGRQKTGRIDVPTRDQGHALDNVVDVPAGYDPARTWPLRVSLHGGVGRQPPGPGDPPARPLNNRIVSDGEIVLHPRAWFDSAWWRPNQIENLSRLLDRVKRDYNVDESRLYVTGLSDGGTGVCGLSGRPDAALVWT